MSDFERTGWAVFPTEQAVLDWVAAARPAAEAALADPAQAQQYDCEGTWFVGVDALPNDARGRVGVGPPLSGVALDAIGTRYGAIPPLHRGQVSVTWPGYPRPRQGETPAGFRYRQKRDGAHVDGLLPIGPERHRMVKEPHLFILGLPLNDADPDAAPLVVWEGSHRLMGAAFRSVLTSVNALARGDTPLTDSYQAARRMVFETCTRVVVRACPGEAIVLHRHLLHGVAAWSEGAVAEGGRRMIAYFRPEALGGIDQWMHEDQSA